MSVLNNDFCISIFVAESLIASLQNILFVKYFQFNASCFSPSMIQNYDSVSLKDRHLMN